MKRYGILDSGSVIARFVAPLTVRSNVPVLISDTLSLKRHVRKTAAQRWEIDTNLEPLGMDATQLGIHLITHGLHSLLDVITPQPLSVINRGLAVQGPQELTQASSLGGSVVHSSSLIPVGCFIKFSNHNKVYIVTANSAGALTVFPTLRYAVRAPVTTNNVTVPGELLFFEDDVVMLCYYDTGTVTGMSYTDGILMDVGTIKLIEAL